MGKQYSFECNNCNLKFHLLEGVGKYSPAPSRNFYCFECEKISYEEKCKFCDKTLEFEIKIPRIRRFLFNEKQKSSNRKQIIICPKCKSDQTKFDFTGEWD